MAPLTAVSMSASSTEQCAGTVKKLSLELGGNAPFIVFENAVSLYKIPVTLPH